MAKIEGYHLQQTGDEVQEILNTPVKTIQQTLTEGQKAQARENIGATSSAVSITYSNLVALRTGGNLVPGQYYRITDYVTTTADAESRSVGHLFDVIVLALDESHLSEEAFATHHDGDTYFANSALDAWRIWYCLDNDTTRFAWADTTNGKGVIYRMIDEYDNDVPYDFKNIQFKRYEIASTTQSSLSPLVGLFIGRSGYTGITVDSSSYKWYYTFSRTGATWDEEVEDASFGGYTTKVVFAMKQLTNTMVNIPRLLNNVFMYGPVVFDFLHTQAGDSGSYSPLTYFTGWEIDGCDCSKNTLVGWFGLNTSQGTFRNNLILSGFRHCSTGTNFEANVIFVPHDFSFNVFGQDCDSNVLCLNRVVSSNFGNSYSGNVIGGSLTTGKITYSYFGHRVANNTFTDIGLASVKINGQLTYCSFSGSFIACSFDPVCGYVDFVGGTNGAACVGLDVVGSVRGTSSSHVTISSSNFILPDASGTNRRIRLEGATDGSIIATWKGTDGVPTGIRSTDNGTTWVAYSPAPIDVVKYTQQTLTDAQKAQARTNIGAGTGDAEFFEIDLFSTTGAEMKAAYDAGKILRFKALQAPGIYVYEDLAFFNDGGDYYEFWFSSVQDSHIRTDIYDSRDGWMTTFENVSAKEVKSNKVTSWSNVTTNGHYPSEKLVKDSLDAKYTKPSEGIPASDIAPGVIPDVSQFITKSVNDLTNYYLKSETYTKDEVAALIGAIQQFHYEIVAARPATGAGNILYLIGPTGSGADKYEEYVYDSTKQDPWVKIGDTSIDLSGYVTTQALNTALAAYTTSADLATLLAAKQDTIADLADIRSGAAAGATAYQKPANGIPASDLATGVIPSVPVTDVTVGGTSVVDGNGTAVIPSIPSAPGWLRINSEYQSPQFNGESLSGTIVLHKVSKTGYYTDLLNRPHVGTDEEIHTLII